MHVASKTFSNIHKQLFCLGVLQYTYVRPMLHIPYYVFLVSCQRVFRFITWCCWDFNRAWIATLRSPGLINTLRLSCTNVNICAETCVCSKCEGITALCLFMSQMWRVYVFNAGGGLIRNAQYFTFAKFPRQCLEFPYLQGQIQKFMKGGERGWLWSCVLICSHCVVVREIGRPLSDLTWLIISAELQNDAKIHVCHISEHEIVPQIGRLFQIFFSQIRQNFFVSHLGISAVLPQKYGNINMEQVDCSCSCNMASME